MIICTAPIISLELKRCHLGPCHAEETYRNSLQRRKAATKSHTVSRQVKLQLGLGFILEQIAGRMKLELYNEPIGYQTVYLLINKNQRYSLLLLNGKRYRQATSGY
ncbi:MAG: hypothetical protein QS748_06770 [Candidatus Endonucleobacter bathymodioli]|uniref:Uncharacterized protein n=1 Tax=Candidatus Endonucleibacter bathymodioli TaxID=539814 RepID=A0AA90NL21_9GAMM|nr:hypothetical protein [Candidatus Endonucleobacter bathymodioli]